MAERRFILDSGGVRLDAATTRRQFSLSLAVGFAVLAAAALVALHPARSAPIGIEGHHGRAAKADFVLADSSLRRN
ncbi:MAG: hypothetical protein ABSF49_05985 [Roseiarcus sp.]|jgi:hypothetical protein|uniref:hypothetical protein n=1 Tax=Roseiarcus sp. TaxID=1969460 RepID=UPI003C1E8D68